MSKTHTYEVKVTWTGNTGTGTSSYREYERAHEISAQGRPPIQGSSDPAFRGDQERWNPEQLLLASLSACHKLQYLHLCAVAGVVVTAYEDTATATMQETPDGGGAMTQAILHPRVTLAPGSNAALARELHHRAHNLCFIASSVRFPVLCQPAN